ncbi:hypothetical protein [Nocardia sp. NPDC049707]|uniref:hypothetical protein n=1 Tax=Nocardia sp. NPDC049707 TaxID=3154735 RepID=UPI0034330B72
MSLVGPLLCVWSGLLGPSVGTIYQKRFVPQVDSRAATSTWPSAHRSLAYWPGALINCISEMRRDSRQSLTWMVLINSMVEFLLLKAMLKRWEAT